MTTPSRMEGAAHFHEPLPLDEADRLHVLNSASTARNIAFTLMLKPETGLMSPSEVEDYFNGLLVSDRQTKHLAMSHGYIGGQLRRWQDDLVYSDRTKTIVDKIGRNREVKIYEGSDLTCTYLVPFAASVARICYDNGIAPVDLVGFRSTERSDGGRTPAEIRLAIYNTLLSYPFGTFFKIGDLATEAGVEPSTMHNHLDPMIRANIVMPFSDSSRVTYPGYKAADIPPDLSALAVNDTNWSLRKRQLTQRVLADIQAGVLSADQIDVPTVLAALEATGDIETYFRSKQSYKHGESVAAVLDFLKQQGILIEAVPASERTTHIGLTRSGERVTGNYLQLVHDISQGNPWVIEEGHAEADRILADEEMMKWLVSIDFISGAISVREKADVLRTKLLNLLHPEVGYCTDQLMAELGSKRTKVHRELQALALDGLVRAERAGRRMRWFANDANASS